MVVQKIIKIKERYACLMYEVMDHCTALAKIKISRWELGRRNIKGEMCQVLPSECMGRKHIGEEYEKKKSMWETEKAMIAVEQGTSVYYVFSVLKDDCRDSRKGGVESEGKAKRQVQGK